MKKARQKSFKVNRFSCAKCAHFWVHETLFSAAKSRLWIFKSLHIEEIGSNGSQNFFFAWFCWWSHPDFNRFHLEIVGIKVLERILRKTANLHAPESSLFSMMACPNLFGPKNLSRWAFVLFKCVFIFLVGHRDTLGKLWLKLRLQKSAKIRARSFSIISENNVLLHIKSSANRC